MAAGAQVIRREEGSFVEFVKEDFRLLIELLRVLKKDAY